MKRMIIEVRKTPVNFIAEDVFGDDKKFYQKFNMNHIHKTDILYNFMYIDMGYIWHFNGLDILIEMIL